MERIPQSVAKRVPLKAYLSSDHISPATGKTIAVVISKNGAAFGNPSGGATNATEVGNGWYYVDLSTTDSGTLGPLVVRGTEGTIDAVEVPYTVANANNAGFAGIPDAPSGTIGTGLALAFDLYHADIEFIRDQLNTQDEYTVTWFKNGARVTAGITVPTLQLVKRADGTDLLAATALTQIGTTGSWKYDAAGANRQTVGEAVVAVVSATIDGATRSFSRVLGRDSP